MYLQQYVKLAAEETPVHYLELQETYICNTCDYFKPLM